MCSRGVLQFLGQMHICVFPSLTGSSCKPRSSGHRQSSWKGVTFVRSCWRILFKNHLPHAHLFSIQNKLSRNYCPVCADGSACFLIVFVVCEDQEKPKEAGTLKTTVVRSASRVIGFSALMTLQLCVFAFVNS